MLPIANAVRHRRFWRRFGVHCFATFGMLTAFAAVIQLMDPGMLVDRVDLLAVVVATSVGFGVLAAWPREIEAWFEGPRTHVRIVRGDLFDQEAHLVIGTCDTFDTAPPIIPPESCQAQLVTRVFKGDVGALEKELRVALRLSPVIATVTKHGKTQRHALGTVATLHRLARRVFLVACTTVDHTDRARGTIDGLWASLSNLWTEVRREVGGAAVAMPVIGGGRSGLAPVLPAEDAIRLAVLSFIIASRRDRVCDELIIVAPPEEFDRLDHLELRAFLRALRTS